ncbi:MAG: hypothetical protein R3360_00745 [Alphaproteobacteria bacterium]|nr:hypothetical protein [Alphaproteobacteria bacterium]
MWVFLHNAFLSITADIGNPRLLQVRARFKGDIERIWPRAVVIENAEQDYRYAAWISRSDVSRKIHDELKYLQYDDLMEKVLSPAREAAYSRVWSEMRKAQNEELRAKWIGARARQAGQASRSGRPPPAALVKRDDEQKPPVRP